MIKDTLYAKYIKQRDDREMLEDENAFVIYKIVGEECFIVDMFVEKDSRGSSKFKSLLDSLSNIASENKCKVISANIHLIDVGATHAFRSALQFGFKLARAENGILLIVKELGV